VGFNPELTGRENVFLNGALLGFTRNEMLDLYEEIVAFAELEKFMDQKLKNYSSGMQVRLAFSIAIRAKSEILILDEVLAVGDEAFQKKCIDVFESYKANKRTVILVTHDMGTVKRFCTRAMLINQGEMVSLGEPSKIANDYTELNYQAINKGIAEKDAIRAKKQTTKTKLVSPNVVNYKDSISLSVDWSACKEPVEHIGVAIYSNAGEYIYGTNTIIDKISLKSKNTLVYKITAALGAGNYHFKVGVFGDSDQKVVEFISEGPEFSIKRDKRRKWEGLVELQHKWESKDV